MTTESSTIMDFSNDVVHETGKLFLSDILHSIIFTIVTFALLYMVHLIRLRFHYDDNKHVSFSINYLETYTDGTHLRLRPINKEISIKELFPNIILQRTFSKAAAKTTLDNMVMDFPVSMESAIMNTIQSYISDDFSDGFVRKAVGLPVISRKFVFMPVHERYENVEVRKIRVIVTQLELLENIPRRSDVKVEKEHQFKRLHTMDMIAVRYRNLSEERQKRYRLELIFDCHKAEVESNPIPY